MGKCRVLIVEDEYFLGDDLAKALRSYDIEVVGPFAEFDEAVSVAPDSFDLALIDINLWGVPSYPLAEKLRLIGKPFVFTTGYGADSIPSHLRDIERWEKPFDPVDVRGASARRPPRSGRGLAFMPLLNRPRRAVVPVLRL